jgi:ketosteroid isomerase-like protein
MAFSEEKLKKEIQGLVDIETRGWDSKNPDLFLSIIHPDMVWAWPPHDQAHDPINWVFDMGRYDHDRWRKSWQDLFDTHDLVHNRRSTQAIKITREGDGAFAVVDVDTLWRERKTGTQFHWLGRACKFYTRMPNGEWKLIGHSGLLTYPPQGSTLDRP